MTGASRTNRRHVPSGLHWRARFFRRTAPFWRLLAKIESSVLRDELAGMTIDRPIYIAGVPRAGSTLLTEMIARHPDVTSHRYSDFPNIYTPFWRNWLAQRAGRKPTHAVERAHRDRIMVTRESPEAVEELIWMAFFDQLHDPTADQALDASAADPDFERFYRDHIRKLLLVRNRQRYLAKGNYNATRLPYLRELFPNARFIIPVRHPINQVASLAKQDRLFEQMNREDPRVRLQLALSGHFEFGPGHQPVCLGDGAEAGKIAHLWRAGRRVEGWASYWASLYEHILDVLAGDEALRANAHIVRYEDLCNEPETVIRKVLDHCCLDGPDADSLIQEQSARVRAPDYYRPEFSQEEHHALSDATRSVANRLGYRV